MPTSPLSFLAREGPPSIKAEHGRAERAKAQLAVTTPMVSLRVLLVEDEPLIRLVAAEMLHDEGFEVVEAADGAQAVKLIDSPGGFDLLLTDVQMPGSIDGIQVAIHARQRHPGIAVVVVSAQSLNARRLSGLGARKAFVGKPYKLPVLMATLRDVLKPEN